MSRIGDITRTTPSTVLLGNIQSTERNVSNFKLVQKKFIIPVVLFIMVELLVTLVEEPKGDILKNCLK